MPEPNTPECQQCGAPLPIRHMGPSVSILPCANCGAIPKNVGIQPAVDPRRSAPVRNIQDKPA